MRPEERLPTNWPFWIGLSPHPKWVPVSKPVVPKDPKQQSPHTEQKAFSLPDTLHHLWDVLMQYPEAMILIGSLGNWCTSRLIRVAHRLLRAL